MENYAHHHDASSSLWSSQNPPLFVSDDCKLPYRRRRGEVKTSIHWGQRKLLCAEVEFLMQNSNGGEIVVYVGSSPGHHISFIAELFPALSFSLFDPRTMSSQLPKNCTFSQQCFTDDIAINMRRSQASSKFIFISDIRSTETQSNEQIIVDMKNQMNWHTILNPIASLLKFRLPWTDGTTEYLRGDLVLPVWGCQTTTETRLLVRSIDNGALQVYDNKAYNESMVFFQSVTRQLLYMHPFRNIRLGKFVML